MTAEGTARRSWVTATTAERLVRQVDAIDAWVAARRQLERTLRRPGMSRDDRMDADRQFVVLRRTHDTIKGHCARNLDADVGPMLSAGPTAVLAHRHTWFLNTVALLLGKQGVTVVGCTGNGAEALGAVVGNQPDLLPAGKHLAMMPGRALLDWAR